MLSRAELSDSETLLNFKRFVLGRVKVTARPGERIPYLEGTERHPSQKKLHFTGWHYMTVPAGQRSGKSISAAMEIVTELGMPDRRIWIVAPTYKLGERVFEYVWDAIVRQEVHGQGSVQQTGTHYSKDSRRIEMKWDPMSYVEVVSADNPKSLKGEQLDLVVVDEAADIPEGIINKAVLPRLANREGRALFIGSPKGRNWLYKFYRRGQQAEDRDRGWRSIRFRTADNPFISKAWLEEMRRVTPEDDWREDYEGEFIVKSGLIWPDFVDDLWPRGHLYNPSKPPTSIGFNCVYRAVDIGQRHPTACVWGAVQPEDHLFIYRDYLEEHPTHDDHAQNIKAMTGPGEKVFVTYISPDAKRTMKLTRDDPHQLNVWDLYRRNGIYTREATNDFSAGASEVSRYLRATMEDSSQHPKIFISRECKSLIYGMQNYSWEDVSELLAERRDAPERPKKKEDDVQDALRYLCAGQPRYVQQWAPSQDFAELDRYGYRKAAFRNQSGKSGRQRLPGQSVVASV